MKEILYNKWKGFLTWIGDIYMATEPPLCKAKHIEDMMEVIQEGDILMRGYNYYLDSIFIPGDYTHSGLVINKREVIHSIAEGVQSIHPMDFVKDTDRFCILRPQYQGNSVYLATDRALWHCEANKTEYDFTFKEDGRYYCHEFTADCLEKAGITVPKIKKSFGVWPFRFLRELYLASSFIIVGERIIKVVYVMEENKDGKTCR